MRNKLHIILLAIILASCSTTSMLAPEEQLYTGLKKIEYIDYERGNSEHFITTQEEMEAALATAPNGALFGSSYYRTPFPYGLWVWNAFNHKNDVFSKWLVKSFGKAPVIMSEVNPELRASVARSVLQNRGYFRGEVSYDIVEGKAERTKNDSILRPRTAKIAYTVDLGHLFTLDSIAYVGFPQKMQEIFESSSLLHPGDPFNISTLDEERMRISSVFRDNGYYYYKPGYATYLADTLQTPGKVQLHLHLADSLEENVLHPWYIGRTLISLRERYNEQLEDSIVRSRMEIRFNGKKPQVRPRVIFNNVKLRRRQPFSQSLYQESVNNLTSTGIFSSLDMKLVPREGTDTLDMDISAVLDKPYDFTLSANAKSSTTGRVGPGIGISFAKRNAFRGGERLSLNLGADYEFQTGNLSDGTLNSYDFSGDVTLEIPRFVMPFIKRRRRWQTTPSTLVRFAAQTVSRGGFFRRNIFSGELSYNFQPTLQSRHQFSPLVLEYNYLAESTDDYFEKLQSMYMLLSLEDRFIPRMRYTYTYTSPIKYRNPIFLQLSVSESANLISLARMSIGKKWNDKDKTLFNCVYSQFVKAEVDWRKTWRTGEYNNLVAHAMLGCIYAFGNSDQPPFSEMYYVGGANDLRAFTIRSVGPGRYGPDERDIALVTQLGNLKLVANLEYRPRLFGSLYGALFLDAGNVWRLNKCVGEMEEYGKFRPKNFLRDLAVDVGVGIRYDLDFFVLRLDWGVGVRTPYSGGGLFNIGKFKNAQCLNFAIGYPF